MNYWAILEHQLCYKNEKKRAERIRKELKECAIDIAKIDKKMLGVKLGIKPNMKKKSMLRTYPVEHK